MIYPWLKPQWQNLVASVEKKRLAHALLFVGPSGLGKQELAIDFAKFLLCKNPTPEQSCGECKSCHLYSLQHHSDIKIVSPEEPSKVIKVDQVREINSFIRQSAHQGGYKVVIVTPAQAMNQSASNALLKSLEEPGDNTQFILIAEQAHQLLPTIISRCQQVTFTTPSVDIASQWLLEQQCDNRGALEFSSGAPLLAKTISANDKLRIYQVMMADMFDVCQRKKNVVELSVSWQKLPLAEVLYFLGLWLSDAIKLSNGAQESCCTLKTYADKLRTIALKIGVEKLTKMYFQTLQLQQATSANISLNVNLAVESVFAT
jgi:DNA polymerase III subunit delta'